MPPLEFFMSNFSADTKSVLTIPYSRGEESANAISHGFGVLFSSVSLILLLINAVSGPDTNFPSRTAAFGGFLLFGLSLIFLYLMSTLFHALPGGKVRGIFQKLDHIAIFLLIAGSYSAFCLSVFYATIGPWMCAAVWTLALLGIGCQILFGNSAHKISLVLYLLMGWLVLAQYQTVVSTLCPHDFALLLAGGILYTVGFIFYALQRFPWMHLIWHIFVLAGSICHVLCALSL